MTTPSEPSTSDQLDDHRLHPLSWLFVLLQQLRSFAIPLVLLLVTGRGNATEWYGLLGVVVLTLVSVAQYFSFRFETGPNALVVRSGILQRTTREIPYERIHTVNLHQTVLHRLFAVAEVRLESAGSREAEAVMRVLSVSRAQALERLIRDRHQVRRAAVALPSPAEQVEPIFAMATSEILKLGVISNRGLVVVAALFGALWQFTGPGPIRLPAERLPPVVRELPAFAQRAWSGDTSPLLLAGWVVATILAFVVVVRLLSVGLALLQFYGFSVGRTGRQLRIERGLLSRIRSQLPCRRIQVFRIDESLLHRLFERQTLRIDSAVGATDDAHGAGHLAPLATPVEVRTLVDRLGFSEPWPSSWQPLHPRAWRRIAALPSALIAPLGLALVLWVDATGGLVWLLIPVLWWRARRLAHFAGYVVTDRAVAVRSGWLNRRWVLSEMDKLQALRLTESPFDRRTGMATLWLDTAGAGAADGIMRLRYLPQQQARDLHSRIAGLMDRPRPLSTGSVPACTAPPG
jgi:putative membrane protein